ncbi:hypothetical protein [Brevundimonas sp. SL161]|uniref:hypothetical protein n=1 Tax=Brevundimonas sp. SL161 TaxID=2804613 RepID=UPI003CF404E9
MTVFIVCHNALPAYQLPEGSRIMWINPVMPDNPGGLDIIAGYDFFENPEILHDKLSGCLGSLAVHRYLSAQTSFERSVTIWQYRKFVSLEPFGRASPNYPGMHLVTSAEMEPAQLAHPERLGYDYIFVKPLAINGIAHQYIRSHNAIDFLRYTLLMLQTGVLGQKQTMHYMNQQHLIPGGMELGTYPTAWWLEAYEKLSRPTLAFADQFSAFQPDDAYQRRAIAFCQERLGSYLLLSRALELKASGTTERNVFGIMHTVTQDQVYRGGR